MILRRAIVALLVCLVATTIAFAAEGDWTVARYDEAQTGFTPHKVELPLTLSWQYDTAKSQNNPSAPAVVGDTAYFASGNRLYAVDAESGALRWKFPAADPLGFSIKTGITAWEDLIFFGGTDGNLYALNAEDGRILWRFATRGSIRSTPVVVGDVVYVGSDDNSLYSINARTGVIYWTGGFRTKDDVQCPPAIATGLVIFASMDANLYAANLATGVLRWNYQLPVSPSRSIPIVSGNYVIIGSGSTINVLSLKNGVPRFTISLPSDVAVPLAVAGDDIYAVCRNRKMYAYTLGQSGVKPKWTAAVDLGFSATCPPTVADDVIFVGCTRGAVQAYSTENGAMLWDYSIQPAFESTGQQKQMASTEISAPIVAAHGALYVLTDDGSLHCFRPDAPDTTPPTVTNVTPQMGSVMSGQPPIKITATLSDESTGVDPYSVRLLLDDDPVDAVYDPVTGKLQYDTPIQQPVVALRDGRHYLTVIAKDWKGNELKHTWSFVVDNTLAPRTMPRTLTNPPAGRTTQPTGRNQSRNNNRTTPGPRLPTPGNQGADDVTPPPPPGGINTPIDPPRPID